MFGTHSRTASDYTQATMNLMNHHWLKYIDNYYVGTSFTPKAKAYVENNEFEVRKRPNSNHVINVTHNALTYEEFLEDEVFDIHKKMDPNTSNGFYHSILNSIEFDKDYQYRAIKAQQQNPKLALPPSFKKMLNIV